MGGEINILSIDKIFNYPIAKRIAPILFKMGIVPNNITIMNIILRIYIIYKSIYDKGNDMIMYYLISHFLDCLDGTLARMFNLQSELGAKLDNISDKIFWGFMLINCLLKCKSIDKVRNILMIIFVLILIAVINCYSKKKCYAEDFIDMNAMIIILITNSLYKKCLN